ncbi:MAG: protein-L-isoaspartate(D-aspartate) O-methyltransferase [Candidatus Omnitrophota bacterium]
MALAKNNNAYYDQRKRMAEDQLVRRGICDPAVIDAFIRVKRHYFVPQEFESEAYMDTPLPLGQGQTISQPYMAAIMTEKLCLEKTDKVLEIGTGSGYQTAILSEICKEVYTIERNEILQERAEHVLEKQGYRHISFKCGDGTKGWPEKGLFNGIIVTAAAPYVPEVLKEQLAEGGRMVIPVGEIFSQMLMVVEKKQGKFLQKNVCGCIFVPLIGVYGWKSEK